MAATPLEQREERLRQLNELLLPLLRAARRYSTLWSMYSGRPLQASRVVYGRGYTAALFLAELPGSHPLVIAVYSSAQRSRPLSPSQLSSRLRALKNLVAGERGRSFTSADIVYIVIAPRGATSGARRTAARQGATITLSPREAAARIARYIRSRLQALLRKLSQRRVWGPLPLLAAALAHLASSLGEGKITVADDARLLQAAEKGARLDSLITLEE